MKGIKKFRNIFFIILLVYTTYTCIHQKIIMNEQIRQVGIWEKELEKVQQENQGLKDVLKLIEEDPNKWYEKQARDKFGLIKEGEIPILQNSTMKNDQK